MECIMSKHKDWFDKHVIIDFGDFNNKEDKKKADDLKEKLKEKLEEELNMLRDKLSGQYCSHPLSKRVLSMLRKGVEQCGTTSPLLKSLILMKRHKKNVPSGTQER